MRLCYDEMESATVMKDVTNRFEMRLYRWQRRFFRGVQREDPSDYEKAQTLLYKTVPNYIRFITSTLNAFLFTYLSRNCCCTLRNFDVFWGLLERKLLITFELFDIVVRCQILFVLSCDSSIISLCFSYSRVDRDKKNNLCSGCLYVVTLVFYSLLFIIMISLFLFEKLLHEKFLRLSFFSVVCAQKYLWHCFWLSFGWL